VAGIVELQARANDFMPKISKLIGGAKEEIWFTGISFYWTLPQNKEEILRKLGQGIPVKFLIYNPLSDNVNEVASGFEQKKENIIHECALTIHTLRTIQDESLEKRTKARLEVKLFSTLCL
jgi:hypothetical protein